MPVTVSTLPPAVVADLYTLACRLAEHDTRPLPERPVSFRELVDEAHRIVAVVEDRPPEIEIDDEDPFAGM